MLTKANGNAFYPTIRITVIDAAHSEDQHVLPPEAKTNGLAVTAMRMEGVDFILVSLIRRPIEGRDRRYAGVSTWRSDFAQILVQTPMRNSTQPSSWIPKTGNSDRRPIV